MTTSLVCKQCGGPVEARKHPGGRPKVFCSDTCRVMLGYWRTREPQTNGELQRRKYLRANGGTPYVAPVIEPIQAAWLAALLDGEGSLSLHTHKKRKSDEYLFPVIAFHNNHQGLIDRYVEVIGPHLTATREREAPKGYRRLKSVTIKRIAQADVLDQVTPYLVAKQDQGRLLLEFLRGHDALKVRSGCTPRMVEIFHEMAALNKRGSRPELE